MTADRMNIQRWVSQIPPPDSIKMFHSELFKKMEQYAATEAAQISIWKRLREKKVLRKVFVVTKATGLSTDVPLYMKKFGYLAHKSRCRHPDISSCILDSIAKSTYVKDRVRDGNRFGNFSSPRPQNNDMPNARLKVHPTTHRRARYASRKHHRACAPNHPPAHRRNQ